MIVNECEGTNQILHTEKSHKTFTSTKLLGKTIQLKALAVATIPFVPPK